MRRHRESRQPATSVIARLEEQSVVLDLRTVFAEQETALGECLAAALR